MQFYNDLAGILMQFKEVCKNWSSQRNQELQWVTIGMERTPLCWVMLCSALKLSRTMQAMSISEKGSSPTPISVTTSQSNKASSHSTTTRKPPPGKSSLGLPSISSSEWDFEELTLPPAPQSKKWNGESQIPTASTASQSLKKFTSFHFVALESPIA